MKRLSLSEITGIAEIIGSIAIVVSLIFVGLQIRQNTRQVETSSIQAGLAYVESINNLTANPETAEVVMKGVNDFNSLSPIEKARFDGTINMS